VQSYSKLQAGLDKMSNLADLFESGSVGGLLRSAPDMHQHIAHVKGLYTVERGGETAF
jgi:hypothetical protein